MNKLNRSTLKVTSFLDVYKNVTNLLLILLILFPNITFAAENGTCGENLVWNYNIESKVLTISGAGRMNDYGTLIDIYSLKPEVRPWEEYIKDVLKVEINEGVTSIGNCAFRDFSSLISVKTPNSLTSIGDLAFSGCHSLPSFNIPNNVSYVGERAFEFCSNLNSIIIPNSVTKLGRASFYWCWGLNSVTLSTELEEIGDYTFQNCIALTEIKLPDKVATIGGSAFADSGLLKIYISKNIKKINSYAFINCHISDVYIEDLKSWLNISFGINSNPLCVDGSLYVNGVELNRLIIPSDIVQIKDYVFCGCKSITSLEMPNSVTSIGKNSFCLCVNLASIELSENLLSIGDNAFSSCKSITSISIPNKVEFIDEAAFENCINLNNVRLSEKLSIVSRFLFSDCYSLKSITLPSSIEYVYQESFRNCDLENLIALSLTPPAAYNESFDNYNAILYVPEMSLSTYKSVEPWSKFKIIKSTNDYIASNIVMTRVKDVMIQNIGSTISVSGADEGIEVCVYDTSGKKVGSMTSSSEVTNIPTSLNPGSIAIVKIGDKSVKVMMK